MTSEQLNIVDTGMCPHGNFPDSCEQCQETVPVSLSLTDVQQRATEDQDLVLYHGGLPDTATLESIDLHRIAAQQNRNKKKYVGFYLADESSRQWSEHYARARNGNMHGFLIDKNARILNITDKDIDRMTTEQLENFAHEYDVVQGKDTLGRAQYILLNKNVVKAIGYDKIDTREPSEREPEQ